MKPYVAGNIVYLKIKLEKIESETAVAVAEAVRAKEKEIVVVTQTLIVKDHIICSNKIATAEG